MNGRPQKHSLTLRGHRTSVSLEDAFWYEFRRIARPNQHDRDPSVVRALKNVL